MASNQAHTGRMLCWLLVLFLALPSDGRLRAQCEPVFLRGDTDANRLFNVTDPIVLLRFLFSGNADFPCNDAADSNDDGTLNVTDSVFSLNFLFLGSTQVPAPSAECGLDPTDDDLDCDSFGVCGPDDNDCDEVDDDCDGEIDEDVDLLDTVENCGDCGNDCTTLDLDNVEAYACVNGKCVIAECEEGTWDADEELDNGCESFRPPNGEPCDDGNPCTTGDIYIGSLCGGTPRDCSQFADVCNYAVCDPDTGECVLVPRPRRACDDDDPDTINDHCDQTGECVGTPVP